MAYSDYNKLVGKLIDSYEFGVIVVDGKRYTSDIIIFQERILDGWWRKEGHRLSADDLKDVLNSDPQPQVIVMGTGYSGLVKVSHEVGEVLKTRKIEFIAEPTKQACETYNRLLKSGRNVVAAFHLTC